MKMKVRVKKLNPKAIVPDYVYEDDSGFDFHSLEDGFITFGEVAVIHTGLAVELPYLAPWFNSAGGSVHVTLEMQIRSKSGLAFKHGITCLTGTIDHGYRGEIGLVLTKTTPGVFSYRAGEKLAQGVLAPVFTQKNIDFEVVKDLSPSSRDLGGFGSTGK